MRGRMDSTFGGAQHGALMGANNFNEMQAGQQMQNDAFTKWQGARQSFFGNEGQMAQNQNQLGVNRGLGAAGMASSLYSNQSNGQNNYNLQAYQAMLQAQQQREQMNFNNTQAINSNRLQFQGQQNQMMAGLPANTGATSFGGQRSFY